MLKLLRYLRAKNEDGWTGGQTAAVYSRYQMKVCNLYSELLRLAV